MAVMNDVMGNVPTSVQPKDNPAPGMPAAGAAAQAVDNSLPPPGPIPPTAGAPAPDPSMPQGDPAQAPAAPMPGPGQMPQPERNVLSKEDQEVDDLLLQMSGKPQPKEVKNVVKKEDDDFDSLIAQVRGDAPESDTAPDGGGLVISRLKGESMWDAAMRNIPETAKAAASQMRARLGRDPVEQKAAFESMYGKENVKTSGKAIYFRPEPGQKFRKVDETLFNGMIDFALFNSLAAVPTAANIGAQIGATATGYGAPVAGAFGGAAEASTKQTMISGLNAISDVDQDHTDFKKDLLWETGVNAAMPIALAGGIKGAGFIGRQAYRVPMIKAGADKIAAAVTSTADSLVVPMAGKAMNKLAQIRTAFNEFADEVFPQAKGKSAEQVADATLSAMDRVQGDLGARVAMIKEEALTLAEQSGKKADTSNTMRKLKEILNANGYAIDPETGLAKRLGEREIVYAENPVMGRNLWGGEVPTGEVTRKSFNVKEAPDLPKGFSSGIDTLADLHNRLHGESIADQGTALKKLFNDIDTLNSYSGFDRETPPAITRIFKSVGNAAREDRNSFLTQLYDGSGLPGEKMWVDAYAKYAQNADAIASVRTYFRSPQERELMADAFAKGSNAEKNEMLDSVSKVLGRDSTEYNALRGSIFDDVIQRNTQNGILNAAGAAKYMNNPSNAPFMDRLFNQKERGTLNRMLIEAQNINKKYGADEKVLEDGMGLITNMASRGIDVAKTMFNALGNNKTAIDYMTDQGFLKLAARAESKELKNRIFEAMRVSDDLRSKMKIIDVPIKSQRDATAFVKKYAPVAGPAMSDFVQKTLGGNQ